MALSPNLWRLTAVCMFVGITGTAQALVEYGNEDAPVPTPAVERRAPGKTSSTEKRPKAWSGPMFRLSSSYESLDVKKVNGTDAGQVGFLKVGGHLQSQLGVFVDLEYYQAQSSSRQLTKNSSYQSGNPLAKLGFNWLKLGDSSNQASFDLYGTFLLGDKRSDFATSRNDQTIGVQTSKQWDSFLFVLEGSLTMTGTPSNTEEMDIGNIQKFIVGVGAIVSDDIRLSLEAANYKIASGNEKERKSFLKEKTSFSAMTPKVYLQLLPSLELEMGASLRMQRASGKQEILGAKLFNQPSAYGNTLFAGLNFQL